MKMKHWLSKIVKATVPSLFLFCLFSGKTLAQEVSGTQGYSKVPPEKTFAVRQGIPKEALAFHERMTHAVKPDPVQQGQLVVEDSFYRVQFLPEGILYSQKEIIDQGEGNLRRAPGELIRSLGQLKFSLTTIKLSGGAVLWDPTQSPSPRQIQENQAIYQRTSTLSEVYEARTGVIKQSWVLQGLPVGASSGQDVIIEGQLATTLTGQASSNKGIEFFDNATGAYVATYGQVILVDSQGTSLEVEPVYDSQTSRLTIVIPADWLSQAVYPVTVDPLIGNEIAISMATIDQSNRDNANWVAYAGGEYLVVWEESWASGTNIQAARIRASDGMVLDPYGFLVDGGIGGYYAYRPSVTSDGSNFFVVWGVSSAPTGFTPGIYGEKIPPDRGAGGFFRQITTQAGAWRPVTAFAAGNYLVGWSASSNLYAARVKASDGTVLDSTAITVSATSSVGVKSMASDGTNFLVVWEDSRLGYSNYDIYGARVRSSDGAVLDSNGFVISNATGNQYLPAVAFDGTNYLVVWDDFRSSPDAIYGARVSPAGTVLDSGGLRISQGPSSMAWPAISFGQGNYLTVWEDYRQGYSNSDIYGTRVRTDGSIVNPSMLAISTWANNQRYPSVAFDGANYLVVWQDYRSGNNYDIYGQLVSKISEPIVTTSSASNITQTGATLAGTANPDGINGTAWFEYGTSTAYGLKSSTVAISGSTANPVSIGISGLLPGTLYHYRIVASSSSGISYGADATFTTPGINTGPQAQYHLDALDGQELASTANTKGLWHLNDGNGTTSTDSSGNLNTGILGGNINVKGDNFDDNSFDTTKWAWETTSGTLSNTESGGKLNLSTGPHSVLNNFYYTDARTLTNALSGNFDIQVDFSNATTSVAPTSTTPYYVLARLLVQDGPNYFYTELSGSGTSRSYSMWGSNGTTSGSSVTTTATSGKLRLVRNGTTVTGYYWNGTAWAQLQQRTGTTLNAAYVYLIQYNNKTGFNISVSFDNFKNTAAPDWTTGGKLGNALSFDGVDDYVNVPANASLNSATFTVEGWFKPNVLRIQGITSKGSGSQDRWRIFMDNTLGNIEFDKYPGEIGNLVSTTRAVVGQWMHFAAVYDSATQTARLYINGNLEQTITGITDMGGNYNYPVYIGSEGQSYYFNGMMDEMAIYNTALSAATISDHYNRGIAKDASGYANNGTIWGPVSTTGLSSLNQALSFDGIDDYVQINSSASLQSVTSSSFTFEGWAKPQVVPPSTCSTSAVGCYMVVGRPGYHVGLYYLDTQKFHAQLWNSVNAGFSIESAVLAPGVWHHLAMVVDDAAKRMSLYVDGQPVSGSPISYTGTLRDYGTSSYYIGAISPSIWNFNGSIDEVKIYNRALTPLEVAADAGASNTSDTTPPTVSITSPANGANVAGTVTVTASATDNVGVSKVEFYLDSGLQSTVTTAPYNWNWDTTLVALGGHSLVALAYDAAGNRGVSASVNVSVVNMGLISGRVIKAQDNTALAGATIQAQQNSSLIAQATTAADGTYTITNLPVGTYTVTAVATGYATQTLNGIGVNAAATTSEDFALSPASVVTYQYDLISKGRLYSVTDRSGDTFFYYDKVGRVVQTLKKVDGASYTTSSSYDALGQVASVKYPDNTTVINYEYDSAALKRVYDTSINYAQYSGYNALGQPGTVTFGNSVVTTYTYSNLNNTNCPQHNFRLCTLVTTFGASTYQNMRYTYDNVGNVNIFTDPINGNQYFGYDEMNRLSGATVPFVSISYAYDEIGNMTCNSQLGTCSGTSPNYSYLASGVNSVRPHAVTSAGPNTYAYDANGNMTSGAGRMISYDYENRPLSITASGATTTFVYDGDGGRVKKTANGVTTAYIGKLYECTPSGCSKYIFAGDQRVAMRDAFGVLYYYHTDHLGSSSVVTYGSGAQSGQIYQQLTYYPYGAINTNSLGAGSGVRHKYTGQELDDTTGLYFYGARYYDPVLGRFISADTIVPNPAAPQALNRYSYVLNNPLIYTDPNGHGWGWFRDFLTDTGDFFGQDVPNLFRHHDGGGSVLTPGTTLNNSFQYNIQYTLNLAQTEEGRYILAAEIIVATAIATWECGGCGAALFLQGALIGEVSGGAVGGYSAAQNGGDISKGILFGTVVGGIAGGIGSVGGEYVGSYFSNELASYIASGTVEGAFFGAGGGATAGYAGGAGNWETILTGTYKGAAIGAATGVVLGGLKYGFKNVPGLDTLKGWQDALHRASQARTPWGILLRITPNLIETGALAFGALAVGTGIELTNGIISEQIGRLARERLEAGGSVRCDGHYFSLGPCDNISVSSP